MTIVLGSKMLTEMTREELGVVFICICRRNKKVLLFMEGLELSFFFL